MEQKEEFDLRTSVNRHPFIAVLLLIVVVIIVLSILGSIGGANSGNANNTTASAPSSDHSSNTALGLSENVGVSLGDAQTIEDIVSRRFADSNIQQAVATDAAKLTTAEVGNATDLTNVLSDVVQGWAFTDSNDALVAMQELYTASKSSAYSFQDFTTIIIQAEPDLKTSGMPFQDCVNALAVLSTQPGFTAETAKSAYLTVAADLNPVNTKPHAALLEIPGVATAYRNKNFIGVLTAVEKYSANNIPTN